MVKPNWDTEELIENWTLLPQELELVKKKIGGNQIGFALLLKHFQCRTNLLFSPTGRLNCGNKFRRQPLMNRQSRFISLQFDT
jgi:hypothetical protein